MARDDSTEPGAAASTRWWDAIVPLAAAGVFVIAGFFSGPVSDPARIVAFASAAALVLVYVLFARPVIRREEPDARRAALFAASAAVILCAAVVAAPGMASLQAIAYPLAWVSARTRRGGILASVAVAVAVFAGYLIGGRFATDAVGFGLIVSGLSLAFSVALGLWITSIAEYGDERARLVDELTAAHAQVEVLSLDRGASTERERLARDIHDTLAQTLAGLVILAERAGRQSREGRPEEAAATIATVERVARDALGEARALVARTAAVPSDDALAAAVQRLVERFRVEAQAQIALEVDLADVELDRERQVVLLRCLQEALANVRKHANASHVRVEVHASADGAVLAVSDDGRGFDATVPRSGYGLDGMRERVALAQGRWELASADGEGTTVRVTLPTPLPAQEVAS